jgi:hypothetical protein
MKPIFMKKKEKILTKLKEKEKKKFSQYFALFLVFLHFFYFYFKFYFIFLTFCFLLFFAKQIEINATGYKGVVIDCVTKIYQIILKKINSKICVKNRRDKRKF